MSTAGELVRKMIQAHTRRDDSAFHSAAEEYIAEERRKNHHILAQDLERVLANGSGIDSNGAWRSLGMTSSELPQDKERGVTLVEVIEPRRSFDELILTPIVRESLDRIVQEQRHGERLRSYGLRPSGKILFCGPPGCGKTVAAETIAQALYLPLVLVRFDAVISSYLGETASNLRKVFSFARMRQAVMLFDEFDAIGKHRTAEEEHGELKRVVNSFLQMLDGFKGESVLIAATNHQGLLDPALWRRFDDIIFFDKPDANAICEVLRRNLFAMTLDPNIQLEEQAEKLVGISHADAERIAHDTLKQTILLGRGKVVPEILDEAISRQLMRTSLTSETSDSYTY